MSNYVYIVKHEDSLSVCFSIEADKVMAIGEKMNEIHEDAYMNGYNWEAFLNFYLGKFHPDLLEEMEADSEAGMCVLGYELNEENEAKAEKLVTIITDLVENEAKLYEIQEAHSEEIEWD